MYGERGETGNSDDESGTIRIRTSDFVTFGGEEDGYILTWNMEIEGKRLAVQADFFLKLLSHHIDMLQQSIQ